MRRTTPSILILISFFLVSCQTSYLKNKVQYQYLIGVPHVPRLKGTTVRTIYIKTVNLTFEKYDYPDNQSIRPILNTADFERDLSYILKLLDIKTVESTENYDATIVADLTLEALPNSYKGIYGRAAFHRSDCYTSAGVHGTLAVSVTGKAPIQVDIKDRIPTPSVISECTLPAKAPFRKAYLKGLLRGFVHLWGPTILIKAVADADCTVGEMTTISADWDFEPFRSAKSNKESIDFLIKALDTKNNCTKINVLKMLSSFRSSAKSTIPAIISKLEDDKPYVNDKAMETLKSITGQNFKKAEKWREWWETAKTKPEYKDL